MNIYAEDYIPYTYLIGWSLLNKWYYGVRYAKGCNPNDLWTTYFTSSSKVNDFRKLNGDPDIIQVRKIFNTPFKAKTWEDNVLLSIPKDKRVYWLNSKFGAFRNIIMTDEIKNKLSETRIKRGLSAGENNPNYKGKYTNKSEIRLKMILNHANVSGKNNPMFGLKGEDNPNYEKCVSEISKMKIKKSWDNSPDRKVEMSKRFKGKNWAAEQKCKLSNSKKNEEIGRAHV